MVTEVLLAALAVVAAVATTATAAPSLTTVTLPSLAAASPVETVFVGMRHTAAMSTSCRVCTRSWHHSALR